MRSPPGRPAHRPTTRKRAPTRVRSRFDLDEPDSREYPELTNTLGHGCGSNWLKEAARRLEFRCRVAVLRIPPFA